MERIVNTGARSLVAQRQPEAANPDPARKSGSEPGCAPREAVCAADEAAGAASASGRLRPRPASLGPVVDAAGAASTLAGLREQFSRHPDMALQAHASPGAEAVLQLLDG